MSEHDKVNILMVDDQPAKLLSYEVILSELGENLIKAGSGREALEHLLKTDIAVVLMDVSMPEIDGFELADIIHQHPRYQKTAIIFISAVHLTDLDQLKGYERGAVDYISVPVIPELLRAKVSVFAELYRKTRQLERLNYELEQRVAERTAALEASTLRLRESEESFRAIFDNAGIGISVLDQKTRMLRQCDHQEMFGYSAEEALNLALSTLTHPDDVMGDIEAFQDSVPGSWTLSDRETLLPQDGQLLWGRFTATFDQGRCWSAALRDRHARRHHRAQASAEESYSAGRQRYSGSIRNWARNQELDAFAYIASRPERAIAWAAPLLALLVGGSRRPAY